MISRNRSISTAAAIPIDRTTSANSPVTCLYSAGVVAATTAAPHSLQNFEFGGSSVPHDPHANPVAVMSWPSILRHAVGSIGHVNIVSPLASQHGPYRRCGPARGLLATRCLGAGCLGRIPPMCEVGACRL